jgi:hypothetical protein
LIMGITPLQSSASPVAAAFWMQRLRLGAANFR